MVATIQDIARRAGVSAGTVSRILNRRMKENRPTMIRRARHVRELAHEMGYRPNAAARSILRGRFGLAGFVTCGDWGFDWFPRSLLHGIHQAMEDHQMRVVITEVPGSKLSDPEYVPALLRESAVDGMVIHLEPRFESAIPFFESQHLPVVWVNSRLPRCSVYPDDEAAAMRVAGMLLQEGHRKIGYLRYARGGPDHFSVAARLAGYRNAMASAGLRPRDAEPLYPADSTDGALDIARRFLRTHADCTAVVCYEQTEAITLLGAALSLGREVPDDLKIITFHEREVRSNTGLSIPTVIIPFSEVGYRSVEMLCRMLERNVRRPRSVAVAYGERIGI